MIFFPFLLSLYFLLGGHKKGSTLLKMMNLEERGAACYLFFFSFLFFWTVFLVIGKNYIIM